ncbi:aldose epimerase family protein [Pseudonocardia sp. TMWB2A]|uniref:aldose epimerase family protein n=1 Tax=Pseudonocardia sp. TMWB2A TaxID=687430 RepID=UPI00307D973A
MIDLGGPGGPVAVTVDPHGARLAGLRAPDRDGVVDEVLLGCADPRTDPAFRGATVGRFANRIAGGRFVLDGTEHVLTRNEPGASLHGGSAGFDHADFAAGPVEQVPGGRRVTLTHRSPDGDGGYPGTLDVAVVYTVTGSDVAIELTARTDAPTVVNLTNHAYFTLGGAGVAGCEITVWADRYLPVDDRLVPLPGPPAPVAGTPFDLRVPVRVGERLGRDHPQLAVAGGFDHTFVLDDGGPVVDGLRGAARVAEPFTGRTLTVFTDRPGVQFYSGTMLDGSITFPDGRPARRGAAFCLEPQDFPDAPNRPDYPSTVLRPGGTYRSRILLRCGVVPA